jgi:hypothetical protein
VEGVLREGHPYSDKLLGLLGILGFLGIERGQRIKEIGENP